MTHLCVPIFVTSEEQAKRDIALAAEAGADMVELRIDTFEGDASDLVKNSIIPTIVTDRADWEGGKSTAPDATRVERLASLGHVANTTDIELKTLQLTKTPREKFGSRLIVSAHDFNGRPDRLYTLLEELNNSPGEISKIVWTARSIRDNAEALEILHTKTKPTIALCMGEAGLISRVLAKKFDAFLTFASLSKDAGTAPGQVTIADMKNLYRWDAIKPSTKIYGVVGSPVMHSMSPAIHNAAFEQVGHDGVYLPMPVNEGYESFKAFMESFLAFEPLNLAGLSITIPHKENALKYLQEREGSEIEPLAAQIGAVNTIVVNPRTRGLHGFSSDYAAILDSITEKLQIDREKLGDYRVAVIGAGGTGRTAVAALAAYGATVVVYNRTRERADALADEFDGKVGKVVAAEFDKICDSCCQIYINTTSVGMYPNVDASPLGDRLPNFTNETLVFDTIYNPMKTKLLTQAEQAGARTIGGVEMFVRQAATQFAAWTGKGAPLDTMRKVIESRL